MGKVSINVPDDVLSEVNAAAVLDDRSRSAWITRVLRRELARAGSNQRAIADFEAALGDAEATRPTSPSDPASSAFGIG